MAKRRDLEMDIDNIDLPSSPSIRRGEGMDGIIGQQQPDITPGTDTELSDDEVDELQRCEAIIERGLKTFFEVGAALLRVRDLRLYRIDHPTFEAYCQERWDFSKTYANNLIAATSVRNNLTTIVVKQLPANEAQARPLAKLKDPEQQREAWERAVATAPGRVTAAHVEAIVREMLASPAIEQSSVQQEVVSDSSNKGSAPAAEAHSLSTHALIDLDAEALRARITELEQRIATAQSIIEEYQEHITRAQHYKPTTDRGEAVSPLLRLVERVWLELQEAARTRQ
jgi:uncharacterized coiled-coil protein SlyX